jgi:hypothetical protein
MVADHEDHGNTPAAWTAATIVMIAFVIASVAVWTMNWPLFWIGGVGLLVVAAIVGKVMSMMGMGKQTQTVDH